MMWARKIELLLAFVGLVTGGYLPRFVLLMDLSSLLFRPPARLTHGATARSANSVTPTRFLVVVRHE